MKRTLSASAALAGFVCAAAVGFGTVEPVRLAAAGPQAPRASAAPGQPQRSRAVLDKSCVSCHNERTKTGGLTLDSVDLTRPAASGEIWEKVARKLRTREMPPAGMARPDIETYDHFAAWLEGSLDAAARATPNPGRPALHRLNRTEYANAIRDLLGLEIDAEALLPADDSTHGFDNIADVLGVSPELLESYVTAGRKISRVALGNPAIAPVSDTYRTAPDTNQDGHLEELPFGTRGGLVLRHLFPVDGEYDIKIRLVHATLGQVRGLQEPHDMEPAMDGERLRLFKVDGGAHMYEERYYNADTPALAADEPLRVPVKAGTRSIYATFALESWAIDQEMQKVKSFGPDFGLKGLPQIEGITITGPYAAARPDDSPGRRILTCEPATPADELPPASATAPARSRRSSPGIGASEDGCAKTIIKAFARRAYRGAVAPADEQELFRFYEKGHAAGGFEAGIEMAVWRTLAAPQFIFRFESDPKTAAPGAAYRISDLELASRLSFFLWSSIPDDQLLNLASRGQLRAPAVLEREVRRMLADPRAQSLVQNFARQWLSLQKLQTIRPDGGRFPDFDDNLRQALSKETELLFEHVMREDRSVLELMTADYTFVNERLARHYGIPNVLGSRFRRVSVPDNRRGLLGHGSVLTVASFPTRTSPVLRGKWVLETLIGSPPPPPPPNVPALNESEKDKSGKVLTMRERMAEHRKNPVCANCHSRMDPLGLALEPFDAVGSWRDAAIDTTGVMPDGTKFDGPTGLREALMRRPEMFVHTMAEKLFTYALGRGVESYDAPAVRAVTHEAGRGNYVFSSLILGVVRSVPFQMRRAADAPSAAPARASR